MTAPTCRQVQTGDRATAATHATMPVVVVLDNLRSAFNVGNILRLADTTRAERVVTCGYTATPPHPKLAKTARGCDRHVNVEHAVSSEAAVTALRAEGYRVYAVETTPPARFVRESAITFPAAFVFGNEALGISEGALQLCDEAVCLPCLGHKNSVNVANCAAVVLYEALFQSRIASEIGSPRTPQ